MAPTTRSTSAKNSPTGSKSGSANQTPDTTPTRKAPHCRTCKRPMQGHRKSSCARPNSQGTTEDDSLGIEELPQNLKALNIASPDFIRNREEENKAFIRNRRRKSAVPAIVPSDTVSSLSTIANEAVARLLQPGIFDNTRVEDKAESTSRIIRWKETIAPDPSKNTKGRQLMPCTLVTPTPDPSFLFNAPRSFQKAESPDPAVKLAPPPEPAEEASTSVSRQPLSRSMSAEQRVIFMSQLADQSAATIHAIPKADAEAIQSQAFSLNFFTHLMSGDTNDPQALLVLGRDESSVKALVRKVEEENRRVSGDSKKGHPKSSPNLKAVAGAAVMGAVGTWAGLAFS